MLEHVLNGKELIAIICIIDHGEIHSFGHGDTLSEQKLTADDENWFVVIDRDFQRDLADGTYHRSVRERVQRATDNIAVTTW